MKKTIFVIALFMGIAFSVTSYANFQDKSTNKTETVKQDESKKSDASCSDMSKSSEKKECAKNCEKSCCKKDTKETK